MYPHFAQDPHPNAKCGDMMKSHLNIIYCKSEITTIGYQSSKTLWVIMHMYVSLCTHLTKSRYTDRPTRVSAKCICKDCLLNTVSSIFKDKRNIRDPQAFLC